MTYRCLLLLGVLALAASAADRALTDNFSRYPAGHDASPTWSADGDWAAAPGGYDSSGGLSVWQAAPYASDATFACDVTAQALAGRDWLVAGIGLLDDERNYWGLNLVVAPEKQERKHYFELQESVNGHWLAAGEGATKLPGLPGSFGNGYDWQLTRTYHLELSWSPTQIVGRILDGDKEVAHFGHQFPATVQAVRAGRPCLRASNLQARFSNATLTVRQAAVEPARPGKVIPPWTSRPGKAVAQGTGYFRVQRTGDQWWLIDPEGKPFFDVGTDHVNYDAHWCEKLGYAPYHRNVEKLYGNAEAWGKVELARLREWGFNVLPAGHYPTLRHQGLPHILFASFGSSFAPKEWICESIHWTGFPDVFSPNWPRHCRQVARRMAKESRGDPWCLGTFLDNELEWYGKRGSLVDEVFQRPAANYAKQALWQWLLARYGTVAKVNEQLGTAYADAAAFLAADKVPFGPGMKDIRDGFLAEIAEKYFSVACSALREADPDHLVLGCRFAGRAPEPALPAAGKYNDVFTFNTYPRVDFEGRWDNDGQGGTVQGVPQELAGYYKVVQRPMIITEWSFPALDSGLPCTGGAGMRVDTQEQKAACYRIFANQMIDLPFMVGYHYFMWADEPALAISSTFPEDSNYGLVNEQDQPYTTLVAAATEVNRQAAERHARSLTSGDLDLRPAPDGVEVVNPSPLRARGWLWIGGADSHRREEVVLDPGGQRRYKALVTGAWYAELQRWDGTKQRLAGGASVKPGEVSNASAQTLKDVPVVLDRAEGLPAVAWFDALEPGRTVTVPPPAGPLTAVNQTSFKADGVTWSWSGKSGDLFDQITAGDLPLGRLLFATHQRIAGRDQWVEASKVTTMGVLEQPDAWIVEALVERTGGGEVITPVDAAGKQAPPSTEPGRYRALVRVVVFRRGGLALVKPLWVENTDSRPWTLVDVFVFCRPHIAGAATDVVRGGPDVPNYYQTAQFWTNQKLGGAFGAATGGTEWAVNFFVDPGHGFHPDARREVKVELAPKGRWADSNGPYLWVYASRSNTGWRAYGARARQLRQSLLTAP